MAVLKHHEAKTKAQSVAHTFSERLTNAPAISRRVWSCEHSKAWRDTPRASQSSANRLGSHGADLLGQEGHSGRNDAPTG
jgi:hypothetical protein